MNNCVRKTMNWTKKKLFLENKKEKKSYLNLIMLLLPWILQLNDFFTQCQWMVNLDWSEKKLIWSNTEFPKYFSSEPLKQLKVHEEIIKNMVTAFEIEDSTNRRIQLLSLEWAHVCQLNNSRKYSEPLIVWY